MTFIFQHNRFLSDAKGKDADVIFIGDSILQALEHTEVWNQWFAPLHCLNFSIHKDQTQNVLWRIKNGELDHVDPKVSYSITSYFFKDNCKIRKYAKAEAFLIAFFLNSNFGRGKKT